MGVGDTLASGPPAAESGLPVGPRLLVWAGSAGKQPPAREWPVCKPRPAQPCWGSSWGIFCPGSRGLGFEAPLLPHTPVWLSLNPWFKEDTQA